jgi:hypothetical protein
MRRPGYINPREYAVFPEPFPQSGELVFPHPGIFGCRFFNKNGPIRYII